MRSPLPLLLNQLNSLPARLRVRQAPWGLIVARLARQAQLPGPCLPRVSDWGLMEHGG